MPSNQRQIIEQAKFANPGLGKAFEKQTEKQTGAIKSLDLSDKKDESKQIEIIFPKNLMNDSILNKLADITNFKYII